MGEDTIYGLVFTFHTEYLAITYRTATEAETIRIPCDGTGIDASTGANLFWSLSLLSPTHTDIVRDYGSRQIRFFPLES